MSYNGEQPYPWIVYGAAFLLVGGLGGYILAVQGTRASTSPSSAAAQTAMTIPSTGAAVVDESALRAYRDILARDPKNVQAAVGAANLLYDGQRYEEAIPLYRQAFALNASDINVSTDLGTALWYTGRADEALAQYAASLAIQPSHPQTLFNLGIVEADGKHDYQAAVAAWERLLSAAPDYPNAAAVRTRIAETKKKIADR